MPRRGPPAPREGDPSSAAGHRRLADVFNFQGSELIIILLLALVVLGPEKLPEAMRRLGRFYADLKKMSTGFQEEFRAAVDEPTRELRDTANTLRDSLDFRKLQDGDRPEKPKSAEMTAGTTADAPVPAPEPDPLPSDPGPFPPDPGLHPPPRTGRQVAVDDEHGLREARPAEPVEQDGAA